jgi:hypothetical protein
VRPELIATDRISRTCLGRLSRFGLTTVSGSALVAAVLNRLAAGTFMSYFYLINLGSARRWVTTAPNFLRAQGLAYYPRSAAWRSTCKVSSSTSLARSGRPAEASSFIASLLFRRPLAASPSSSFLCSFLSLELNFSAWIGLVPKQHSSGGRDKLGSISKQGDRYLRSLFTAGALALIRYAKIHGTKHRL